MDSIVAGRGAGAAPLLLLLGPALALLVQLVVLSLQLVLALLALGAAAAGSVGAESAVSHSESGLCAEARYVESHVRRDRTREGKGRGKEWNGPT